MELAKNRYISAVYFHTLFLFSTTKSRSYELTRATGASNAQVDLADYLSDLFSTSYAQFLLNFETSDILAAVG